MQYVSFEYSKGYFKALLDLLNYIDNHSEALNYHCKNRKLEAVYAIIRYLLSDSHARDVFMEYGGELSEFVLSPYDKKNKCFYVSEKGGSTCQDVGQ